MSFNKTRKAKQVTHETHEVTSEVFHFGFHFLLNKPEQLNVPRQPSTETGCFETNALN